MAKKPDNLSFEASLAELEQIVQQLEQGDVPLEQALQQFERGIALVRASQSKLQNAEQQVAILSGQADSAATLAPFEPEA